MMPFRRARWAALACACACAVAGLAGCGGGDGPPTACSEPPEHAYVLNVTTAGRVRWQVPAAQPGYGLPQLSPLAVGAVAVLVYSANVILPC